jgi:hypothetical protein
MDDNATFFPIWMSQVPNPKIKYEIKCSMIFLNDSMNFLFFRAIDSDYMQHF